MSKSYLMGLYEMCMGGENYDQDAELEYYYLQIHYPQESKTHWSCPHDKLTDNGQIFCPICEPPF